MSPSPPTDDVEEAPSKGGGGDVSNDVPDEPDAKGPLKPVGEYTPTEIVAGIIGIGEFALALAHMIMSNIPGVYSIALSAWLPGLVTIGGIMAMVLGPYLYWQRTRLTDIRTFKEVQQALENQVKDLKKSIESLTESLKDLTETTEQLEMLKETFDKLSAMGGESIDEFEKSVARQRENVANHGEGLKARLVRYMADYLEDADQDGDAIFDEDEVEEFILNLRQMEGLIIYEDRIRAKMTNAPMEVAEQMLMDLHDDEAPEDEILFDVTAA